MKVSLKDAVVTYYSENREQLLGVCVATASGYSLYKPVNTDFTDWERLASSKNPCDFDSIVFGKSVTTPKKTTTKLTKNNIEDTKVKPVKKEPKAATVKYTPIGTKRVKRSFL
jgi:hypothetical protein